MTCFPDVTARRHEFFYDRSQAITNTFSVWCFAEIQAHRGILCALCYVSKCKPSLVLACTAICPFLDCFDATWLAVLHGGCRESRQWWHVWHCDHLFHSMPSLAVLLLGVDQSSWTQLHLWSQCSNFLRSPYKRLHLLHPASPYTRSFDTVAMLFERDGLEVVSCLLWGV